MSAPALWAALGTASLAALAYGFVYSWRGEGPARALLKVSGILILAGIAYGAGGAWLLWAALLASAVGDLFLAGKPERWLLLGMGAFFLAHVFYVALFWQLGEGGSWNWPVKVAQGVLVLGGVFYIRWLVPWIEAKMRVPVILYGAVILMMGAAAMALPSVYGLVIAGAMMFIASDSILAHQLFCRQADALPNKAASYAVWFLYFFGQAAITLGLIGIPA